MSEKPNCINCGKSEHVYECSNGWWCNGCGCGWSNNEESAFTMPTQSLTDQLRLLEEEITKHDQAASPGPWVTPHDEDPWNVWEHEGDTIGAHCVADCGPKRRMSRGMTTSIANAAFIAFARTALLDLLAVAKGLEAELTKAQADLLPHYAAIKAGDKLVDELSKERDALRAKNERLRAWLKKAGEDLTKESEAQAAEDLERYMKDPDYH